ncbi:MAG: prolipoprotein diacylglyceryl transferase [Clostridiales bacterium]|nr:prolipoprotein diacylglyceryl transferase [Clostridiales bacterium]
MIQPNPVAFSIGNIDIRWYGILIAAAMCISILISVKRASLHNLTGDDVLDVTIWMLPIGIIGARFYYVLFNLNYYNTFAEMINIRNGGLAIHGGLIFGIATLYIVCKRKKINPLNMMDLLIPSVALAQSIGRWGNFFNGEAHGGPTNLPWGIIIDNVKVHPTYLYESIWCLVLFFFLSYYNKNRRKAYGQTIALYGILYSIERFFVESLRTDSLMIGTLKQAQLLSVVIIILCTGMYFYCRKNQPITSK